ncbi:NAD(P)-binding domain-containing protein [Sphingomonas sp. OK281]|uniref:NAD(P)-binding domain-containing protein n=1 Tax=Sphingomonas sp. OK281 TaxID=1881067 RepID=UPI000A990807|nr:NAD(P)-binding domain-containing protein [Sphingomonas sp. OK281]
MTYAIIGFGEIGQTLAKTFARKGIAVSVATTRDPESFASTAVVIGPGITPPRRSRRTALGQGPCRRVRRRQGGQGFNHLVAAVLDQDPALQGGRRVVFLSSDDDDAAAQVGALARSRLRADPARRAFGRWAARSGARQELGPDDLQGPDQVRPMNTSERDETLEASRTRRIAWSFELT